MPEQRLRAALEVLHEELGSDSAVSGENRDLLRTVAADLERVLEQEQDADHAPLVDRLERAAVDFESEHPQLARTLNEIVAALARMGI